jgi:hypothetical protein
MPMKKYKPEQIVTLLRQVEVELANGKTTPQACKEAEITAQTYYRWRKEFGGLKLDRSISQPQPPSRPLFLRYFQPFAPPDPLHVILAYMPAAIPQQRGDPPVAVAPVFAGECHDLSRQSIFVGSIKHRVALCSSPLPQQPAGMPLRYLVILACMPDRATPPLRA